MPLPMRTCSMRPHLIADPLVGLEVERQLGVVPLNDDLGRLLDRLCSNATHFGDCKCMWMWMCGGGREVAVGVVTRSSLENSDLSWDENIQSVRLVDVVCAMR